MPKWIFILCALLAAAPGWSADAPASPETARQLQDELRLLLGRLAASGALGSNPEQATLRVDEPAQRFNDLGLLVDSTNAERSRDGLRVLGVTPGSLGEHLGLRTGDVLVAINGTSLRGLGADGDGHALAARTLKSAVDGLPDKAPVVLQVQRGGESVELRGTAQSLRLPAFYLQIGGAALAPASDGGSCGRISTFDLAPPQQQLYRARVLLIDGVTPGTSEQHRYRVSAGPHKLLVAEDIPSNQMGIGSFAQMRRDTSKTLDVNVEPGTTLMIAALLHRDRASEVAHGEYWDPVVWKVAQESCP
ncbi:MAG TPA: PDZ domain-containing protein [Rudaea sp.]